jgi:coumaroylquinate(coumaroylshikimate) 3'-monooxygenase
MIGHLLHQFEWSLPEGTRPEDVNMMESNGVVTFMSTSLQVIAKPRLDNPDLYKRFPVEM